MLYIWNIQEISYKNNYNLYSIKYVQAIDKSLASSTLGVCGRECEWSLAFRGQPWLRHNRRRESWTTYVGPDWKTRPLITAKKYLLHIHKTFVWQSCQIVGIVASTVTKVIMCNT